MALLGSSICSSSVSWISTGLCCSKCHNYFWSSVTNLQHIFDLFWGVLFFLIASLVVLFFYVVVGGTDFLWLVFFVIITESKDFLPADVMLFSVIHSKLDYSKSILLYFRMLSFFQIPTSFQDKLFWKGIFWNIVCWHIILYRL